MRGFKFHPSIQGFDPNDRSATRCTRRSRSSASPALFHTGQTGIGAGRARRRRHPAASTPTRCSSTTSPPTSPTCGSSWRTRRSRGRTRRSRWPRTSRTSTSTCPAGRRSTSRRSWCATPTRCLQDKVLFGSDFPVITPDRWLADFDEARHQTGGASEDPQGQRRPPSRLTRTAERQGAHHDHHRRRDRRAPGARRHRPRAAPTGSRSPRSGSTRSPTPPTTTSGSTSTRARRRPARSAARSRTAT